jgi:hypothetical protein
LVGLQKTRALRGRDEIGYEDEDQLRGWLTGIEFDDRQFGLAIGHLWRLGRLQQPRADAWTRKGSARPTWLIEPVVHIG